MALTVKHKFVSPKTDSNDASLIQPSNWNDDHEIVDPYEKAVLVEDGDTLVAGRLNLGGGLDPYENNVVLRLPFDGANGSTTFTDTSPVPKIITPYGNAQISTAQSKFGGASAYFDGSGDYLSIPSSTDFSFPADFTYEFFIYSLAWVDNGSWVDATVTGGFAITNEGTSTWKVSRSNSSTVLTGLPLPSLNAWHHIAISRSNGVLMAFVDGVQAGSVSDSAAFVQTGVYVSGTSSWSFNGYIDDLRITKGVARYTSNFTPPLSSFIATYVNLPYGAQGDWLDAHGCYNPGYPYFPSQRFIHNGTDWVQY